MITPLTRKLSKELGVTEYGTLILSAFPDEVFETAVVEFRMKRPTGNIVSWLFSTCRAICELKQIEPNYEEMFQKVKEVGYKPGDKLFLYTDKESQFRYDDVPEPKKVRIKSSTQTKPINMNNAFLKQFGIPAWAKENDLEEEYK